MGFVQNCLKLFISFLRKGFFFTSRNFKKTTMVQTQNVWFTKDLIRGNNFQNEPVTRWIHKDIIM